MINIFLEKSYTKYGGENISRPFSIKKNLSMPSLELSKYIKTKLHTTCFYLKFFGKTKKRSRTSFTVMFCALLLKKNISLVIFD